MNTILTSEKNDHVFWCPPGALIQEEDRPAAGGWYFWDEVGLLGAGPHVTELEAIRSHEQYVKELNSDRPQQSALLRTGIEICTEIVAYSECHCERADGSCAYCQAGKFIEDAKQALGISETPHETDPAL